MKTKRLFTFIVAVMMIFGVISPVSAETVTVETPIGNYDKTFNTYADFAALQAADSKWTITSGAVTLEAEAGNESNKAIKYTNVDKTYAKSKYMFASPISSGILKISFKTKGLAVRFCPTVFGSDGTSQSYLGRISSTRRAVCAGSWADPSDTSPKYNAAIDENKWYTWEVTIDLDAAKVTKDVDIKDSEGTVIASRRDYRIADAADKGTTYTTLTGFGIMNGDNVTENTEVYLDDLSISHLTKKTYVDNGTFGTYDTSFDSYANLAALQAADANWTISKNVTLETESESNQAIKVAADGKNTSIARYMFGELSGGIVKLSFRTKGYAPAVCLYVNGIAEKTNDTAYSYLGNMSLTNNTVTLGVQNSNTDKDQTYVAAISQDEWYTWEATIDLNVTPKKKNVVVKNSSGDVIAQRLNYNLSSGSSVESAYKSINTFSVYAAGSKTGSVYLDDVVIEITLPAPKVTESSVTLENVSGETVAGLTNISPDIKKINIDFGIDVDDATITKDTVKLVKYGETDGVSYTGTYANGVYTMELDEILDGSSTYNLFVSKDIKNMQRTGMESDANIGITTGKARFDATINSIVIGGAEVKNIAGLTQDASATINISYSNFTKTEKPVCVIVAYYDGNLLVGADYIKDLSVSATDYTGTLAIPHTVLSTTDVDLVKVMVWDGLGTMRSLTTSYPVSAQ